MVDIINSARFEVLTVVLLKTSIFITLSPQSEDMIRIPYNYIKIRIPHGHMVNPDHTLLTLNTHATQSFCTHRT
jgi:hypothetical protein